MAKRVADQASETLRLRILSALVMAPVAIILVWLGGWFFLGLAVVAGLLMNHEWDRLCDGSGRGAHLWLLAGTIVAAGVLFQLDQLSWSLGIAVVGALASAVLRGGRHVTWTLLGAVYIILPILALIWLRREPSSGLATVIWLLFVVWATDTGAYVFGRLIGGPKMAPRISPNKTWAGLLGGAAAAALIGIPAGWLAGAQSPKYLIVSGAILAIVGQAGDVFESSIKRHFNAKDSGTIIPGHGGLFDRLDSLLFVAVVYAAMIILTGGADVWR
jgi:phosphatidate cytidylyltransferase